MRQVLLPSHEPHILPTIKMLVQALKCEGIACERSPLAWKPARAAAKLLSILGLHRFPAFLRKRDPVFIHVNHPWCNAFYPYGFRHPLVTYSFDLWPYSWDEWQKVFETNRPAIAFISAKIPMMEMQRRLPDVEFRWLPEAVDPGGFDPSLPLSSRPIDVLEIGRPFVEYHDQIRLPLADAGYEHHYPIPAHAGGIPYEEVVKSYGRSKLVVCFPRSITHPNQAKNVETTTFRYFECMASKALMIGHCPQELIEILGHNPVIEADMKRPGWQLVEDILPHISEYQGLVDRNYEALCKTWTVNHQAEKIRAAMEEVLVRMSPAQNALIS